MNAVGFWCQGIAQKNLQDFWHQFWDKNEDKNEGEKWCRWIYFQISRALSELPTNWPGRLSQKSWLGLARWDLKWFQWHHFSPSFLCQNWCQTSWRIFVLFPGTKNLQCIIFQKTKQRVISFFFSDYVSTYLQCSVDHQWHLESIHTFRIESIHTLLLSRTIPLKGYGSTQDVIDGPHCRNREVPSSQNLYL